MVNNLFRRYACDSIGHVWCQGLALPKAWIDIGKSERSAGVSYVAISQVKSLALCLIEPMTYKGLTCLKSSANLQYRLGEENRLDHLAQVILTVHLEQKTIEFQQLRVILYKDSCMYLAMYFLNNNSI